MGTGGFLMVITQTWDALLIPNPRPNCLKSEGDRYPNLAPFVQFVDEPGTGNCVWIHTESKFPVLVAKEDLEEGVSLRAEECLTGGEGRDSPLQQLLKELETGNDCPIDGIVLIDTRPPEDQVGYQTWAWQTAFGDQETFIRILASQSNCDRMLEKKIHGRSLVGGSTLLFFPRPDLRVRTVNYDPTLLGILTCVIIGIGPTDSVLWIAAYIPFRGEKQEGEGLEAKGLVLQMPGP
jgi:hypothetical protein